MIFLVIVDLASTSLVVGAFDTIEGAQDFARPRYGKWPYRAVRIERVVRYGA